MTMTTYEEVAAYAKSHGHVRMCAPLAMCLVTGRNFLACHVILKSMGFRANKRTGTTYGGWQKAIRKLGFETKVIELPPRVKTNISLAGVLDPKKRYIITYSRHVAAVVDGQIQDWTLGRRNRIRYITEVIPLK